MDVAKAAVQPDAAVHDIGDLLVDEAPQARARSQLTANDEDDAQDVEQPGQAARADVAARLLQAAVIDSRVASRASRGAVPIRATMSQLVHGAAPRRRPGRAPRSAADAPGVGVREDAGRIQMQASAIPAFSSAHASRNGARRRKAASWPSRGQAIGRDGLLGRGQQPCSRRSSITGQPVINARARTEATRRASPDGDAALNHTLRLAPRRGGRRPALCQAGQAFATRGASGGGTRGLGQVFIRMRIFLDGPLYSGSSTLARSTPVVS